MKYFVPILVGLFFLLACKKDKPASEITPVITIESISTTNVTEFKDSIIIILSYEDSDGDLGRQDPDNNSLWIKDDRVPAGETYHLPPIVSETDNYTKGTIRVFIPSLFLFGNGNQEKTKLTLRIQDQGGHWSDEVVTPIITVNR
jgi:hypothetical protein